MNSNSQSSGSETLRAKNSNQGTYNTTESSPWPASQSKSGNSFMNGDKREESGVPAVFQKYAAAMEPSRGPASEFTAAKTSTVSGARTNQWLDDVPIGESGDVALEERKLSVCLFRNTSLRLLDNKTLKKACEECDEVLCVYILEEEDLAKTMGVRRASFLKECLWDLDKSLRMLGQQLFVFKGDLFEVMAVLVRTMNVRAVYIDDSQDPDERSRLMRLEEDLPCVVDRIWHRTIVDHEFLKTNTIRLLFPEFLEKALDMPPPCKPIPAPADLMLSDTGIPDEAIEEVLDYSQSYSLPKLGANPLHHEEMQKFMIGADILLPKLWHMGSFSGVEYWYHDDDSREIPCSATADDNETKIQRFNPLKYCHLIPGGERKALERLGIFVRESDVRAFRRGTSIGRPGADKTYMSTVMSPYFAWGCVSVHLFYHVVSLCYERKGYNMELLRRNINDYSATLLTQLYWREFFIQISYLVQSFDSPKCPLQYNVQWEESNFRAEAVINGVTGIPCIDAIVIHVRNIGWVGHISRRILAQYITHSGMLIHWKVGVRMFKYFAVDYEYGITEGNWMLEARNAFCRPVDVLSLKNVIVQFEELEGSTAFIRSQIPALATCQEKYVHRPWTARTDDYKEIMDGGYPKPVVELGKDQREFIDKRKEWLERQLGTMVPAQWNVETQRVIYESSFHGEGSEATSESASLVWF